MPSGKAGTSVFGYLLFGCFQRKPKGQPPFWGSVSKKETPKERTKTRRRTIQNGPPCRVAAAQLLTTNFPDDEFFKGGSCMLFYRVFLCRRGDTLLVGFKEKPIGKPPFE